MIYLIGRDTVSRTWFTFSNLGLIYYKISTGYKKSCAYDAGAEGIFHFVAIVLDKKDPAVIV